jgi:hypothetical protein
VAAPTAAAASPTQAAGSACAAAPLVAAYNGSPASPCSSSSSSSSSSSIELYQHATLGDREVSGCSTAAGGMLRQGTRAQWPWCLTHLSNCSVSMEYRPKQLQVSLRTGPTYEVSCLVSLRYARSAAMHSAVLLLSGCFLMGLLSGPFHSGEVGLSRVMSSLHRGLFKKVAKATTIKPTKQAAVAAGQLSQQKPTLAHRKTAKALEYATAVMATPACHCHTAAAATSLPTDSVTYNTVWMPNAWTMSTHGRVTAVRSAAAHVAPVATHRSCAPSAWCFHAGPRFRQPALRRRCCGPAASTAAVRHAPPPSKPSQP